jgi:hypothetical protein
MQEISGATPEAFGGIAAAGVVHAATTVFDAKAKEAHFDAFTETQEATSSLTTLLNGARLNLSTALKNAPTNEAIEAAQKQYVADVASANDDVQKVLRSDLSKRNFGIHARPHLAQADRIAGMEAAHAKRSLTSRNVAANFEAAVEMAGAVTATDKDVAVNPQRVLDDAAAWEATLKPSISAMRVDMAANGSTDVEIPNKVRKLEAHAVKKALDGYALQPKAGLAFLGSTLSDGRRIFDRDSPSKSVLTAGDADPLIKALLGSKTTKTANNLAGQWALEGLPAGTLDDSLRQEVKAGTITYAETGEVAKAYYTRQSERAADEKRGIESQSNSFFELVAKKYGGDLEVAKRDPQFLIDWNRNSTSELAKLDVAEKLARLSRDDGTATGKMIAFMQETNTPGWSLKKSKEAWTAQINGLGQFRSTAMAMMQSDLTDRNQERIPGERAMLHGKLENYVRLTVGFVERGDGMKKDWIAAAPNARSVYASASIMLSDKLNAISKNAAKDPSLNVQELQESAVSEVVRWTKQTWERVKNTPEPRISAPEAEPVVRPAPPKVTVPTPSKDGEIIDGAVLGYPGKKFKSLSGKWVETK